MFEDDVVFDDDFVPRFLKASAALPEDWDVFMLNWWAFPTTFSSKMRKELHNRSFPMKIQPG